MNTANITNITSLQKLAYVTNNYTDGVLFIGGLIVFFIVILMILIKNEQPLPNALAISSWSIFIVASLLWYASLVPTIIPLTFLILTAFTTLYLYTSNPY